MSRPRRFADEAVAAWYADYQSGMSTLAVGAKYGMTCHSIVSAFRSRGLKLRDRLSVIKAKALAPTKEYMRSMVDVTPSGCWEWKGPRLPTGYGKMTEGGAHRVAWRLWNGPIPDGLHVLHHCDNPPCINHAHLFTGTARDNAIDKERKARGFALLTEAQVREMRAEYVPRDKARGAAALGRRFGVSRAVAHKAIVDRHYKWVS